MSRTHVVVDRVEGKIAVLLTDDGEQFDVPVSQLPLKRIREGDVYSVEVSPKGLPEWSSAKRDQVEARRRAAEAKRVLRELKATDPGGDIVL